MEKEKVLLLDLEGIVTEYSKLAYQRECEYLKHEEQDFFNYAKMHDEKISELLWNYIYTNKYNRVGIVSSIYYEFKIDDIINTSFKQLPRNYGIKFNLFELFMEKDIEALNDIIDNAVECEMLIVNGSDFFRNTDIHKDNSNIQYFDKGIGFISLGNGENENA